MRFLYSERFCKQIEKLSVKTQTRARERLELFRDDSFSPILKNHKLHGPLQGLRTINVTGDVRIVYQELDNGTCHLIAIGRHKDLYE